MIDSDFIESRIAGIPCLIEVTSFLDVKPWKGSAQNCPSDLDYYGYIEIEFTVRDRKGYPADWLQRKMSQADEDRIHDEIIMKKDREDWDR